MKSTSPERTIKVVIDTNVLISAGVSKDGNPAQIFELLLIEAIENYTSEKIILISGDPHLLEIKKFQEIKVVSPKEFLENFKTKL